MSTITERQSTLKADGSKDSRTVVWEGFCCEDFSQLDEVWVQLGLGLGLGEG